MARGELIGCFGLTGRAAPGPGFALRRGRAGTATTGPSGHKMWDHQLPLAHLAIVWAMVEDGGPETIRGFIAYAGWPASRRRRSPASWSRASETGEIVLQECRVPASNVLPDALGLRAPLSCLSQVRFGLAWGAIGAAKACFESTVSYTVGRLQFGKPGRRKSSWSRPSWPTWRARSSRATCCVCTLAA
ncbi:MAG: acyl-CoA dehydrogenase family protein [Polyangiaceae bacterium]